ncbi:hypothetical protein ACWGI8_23935 [Streptomyces sp. NPDC054841]
MFAVREFTGDFETHLTVHPPRTPAEDERLGAWAADHGLKLTRIVLDRGATPDQPMLSGRGSGGLGGQLAAARRTARQLDAAGFPVIRTKIEAAPWNEDVPRTAAEALQLPPHCGFEHHVKLLLDDAEAIAVVRAVAEAHDAHVSRNARRGPRHGRHERFVTQRCHAVGRPEARRRLDALLTALSAAGFRYVEVEEEFVVHDDRPSADAGWIEGAGR